MTEQYLQAYPINIVNQPACSRSIPCVQFMGSVKFSRASTHGAEWVHDL
jgi:hypothetical protein